MRTRKTEKENATVTKQRECWQPKRESTMFNPQLSHCRQASFQGAFPAPLSPCQKATPDAGALAVKECRMAAIRTEHHHHNVLHLRLSPCQHLPRVCLPDLHHLKRGTEALKDFYPQVSTRHSSRTTRRQAPLHQVLHRQVSARPPGVLHRGCLRVSNSQVTGEHDEFWRTVISLRHENRTGTQKSDQSEIWKYWVSKERYSVT